MAVLVHGSGFSKDAIIKNGKAKAYNTKKRTLAAFFRFTREEGGYAQNWSSKGKMVPALITLTYPDNSVWQPDQITAFINNLRNYAFRKWGVKLRYAWVAEATRKGVIHYHIVVWHPRNKKFPKPDNKGWWKYGSSKIEGVRKGVYSYLLKYISKDKDLNVCRYNEKGMKVRTRTFSHGGLSSRDREFLSHQMLPKYIKTIFGPIPFGARIRRVKGGWECKELPDEPFEDVWLPFRAVSTDEDVPF